MNLMISITIVLISVSVACLMIRKENIHCMTLDECIAMIKESGERASQFNESFSEILINFKKNNKYTSTEIPDRFVSCLNNGDSIPYAWNNALRISGCSLYQWERDVLKNYGNKLFFCPKEQIEECTFYAIAQLSDFRDNATEKKNRTTRTSAVCTVSAGIMIALLIL